MTQNSDIAAIILAAGKGTRMKSDLHKVLHPIAGRPMLFHLMDAINRLKPAHKIVVAGDRREQLEQSLSGSGTTIALQEEQLGTAHAALQAKSALSAFTGNILICFGDVPFLRTETVQRLCDLLRDAETKVAVLAFRPADAGAYGRIVTDGRDRVIKMVEYKDADDAERKLTLCNSGVMVVHSDDLWRLLESVGNDNAAGEYYLPDVVTNALGEGHVARILETSEEEVAGVNSRFELAAMEAAWQQRRRKLAMESGVSMTAPETVFFSYDTSIGRDVMIEPNVFFGPGVSIASHVSIHAFSHIEGATICAGASVGPFARLRPGALLEEDSKVGNFVEMKKATLGKGAKANHLTYLGDAMVGAGANIGAGTITCNYDGYFKYQTVIGEGAFIGSNSALVAPVKIGKGAIVGAGSTVTKDVAAGDLALTRAEQSAKTGWADRFNEASAKKKAGR
ncbi:bifunctional UDP-N-acetylglucosamine diphosphorylase/glucosamine-1-phosphate N-acetyltransferase GlmU [Sphingorhabdus arenilitoris]|uniref:Bifunctional protein GlmU n=1 Tax=Sphingorhabdus arenilitoris TaxID=1490041 RepID=A0ABV8RK81_9SPHN